MARFFLCCLAVMTSAITVVAFSAPSSMRPRRKIISPSSSSSSSSAPLLSSSSSTTTTTTTASSDAEIREANELLRRAARTKLENPDRVLDALSSLERNCKLKFGEDPVAFGRDIMDNISGEWRLIFTTGTRERQERSGGRVNYFPLKAIQKFDVATTPMIIENGIYGPWDVPLLRFTGDFDYDARRRKVEFDFDMIEILGLLKVRLGRKDAAKIGGGLGLGSANNEKLADMGRRAFFDWISADDEIATARGGGGGLALWKRVVD
ncbi:hypothetical protein ACHAW5_006137 [Stephanodiscus triporus]|uniref:Plastid lipid-associated protein/fibrillin conserved domain-containing protein n=1 Tax=Stephanodiscus triporus TaxID=2934178 RepID=A0ABD3MDM7_9STRA